MASPPLACQKTLFRRKDCAAQGELEGARPASNEIKCPAKPCKARRAVSAAKTFPRHCRRKVAAFFRLSKIETDFLTA